MKKRRSLFLFLAVAMTATLVGQAWAQTEVITNDDMWLRQVGGVYPDDGISIWSSGRESNIRVGYFGFDLSAVSGAIGSVTLEVWEDPALGSGANYPCKTIAYLVSAKPTSWSNWQTLKASGTQLDTLGAFDVDAVGTGNPKRKASTTGSSTDIADVQAAIGGTLHMVIECVEDGTAYSMDLADLEYSGGPGAKLILGVVGGGGPVTNLSPANGASEVSRDAVLDWDVNLLAYNESPDYTVYIDTDPEPNVGGTMVNITDETITSYDPDLAFGTTYWWMVNVTDPNGDGNGNPKTYTGDIWSFSTEKSGVSLPTSSEVWIRETAPTTTYENDAIFVMNTVAGDRRYGLIGFDVSGLAGQTVYDATLWLYSSTSLNGGRGAMKQDAYVISSTDTALADLNWNTYMSEKDPNKVALGGLGVYDLPDFDSDTSQHNTFMESQATLADRALIQAAVDGNGLLYIVLIAQEDVNPFQRYWGDGVYGLQPILNIQTGAALNPTPPDEAPEVDPNVVMSWEIDPDFYSQSGDPTFTLYIDDDPDLSDATPIDNGTSTSYDPSPDLDYETDYWWRVDVTDSNFGSPITYPGFPWSFTTMDFFEKPVLVSPLPTDDPNVDDVVLEWSHTNTGSVDFRVSYRIAGIGDPFTELTTTSATSYDLSANVELEWGVEYEWRVDVVVASVVEREGDLWRFTTHTLQCINPVFDVTGPDGVPDCTVNLLDFAEFALEWLKCGIDRNVGDCIWPRPGPEGIESSEEAWISEYLDGKNFSGETETSFSVASAAAWPGLPEHGPRYGLIEFDLSDYAGQTLTEATLYLFSPTDTGSPTTKPLKQAAYKVVVPGGGSVADPNYYDYLANMDPGKVAFETLGSYDIGIPVDETNLQDKYVASVASAADLAMLQAIVDGDGKLQMVLIAIEDTEDYRQDWGSVSKPLLNLQPTP